MNSANHGDAPNEVPVLPLLRLLGTARNTTAVCTWLQCDWIKGICFISSCLPVVSLPVNNFSCLILKACHIELGWTWEYVLWISLINRRMSETDRMPRWWNCSSIGLHWNKLGQKPLTKVWLEATMELKQKFKHGRWNEYHEFFWSNILFNNLLSWRCPVVNDYKIGSTRLAETSTEIWGWYFYSQAQFSCFQARKCHYQFLCTVSLLCSLLARFSYAPWEEYVLE
jgi:hypothetical protein